MESVYRNFYRYFYNRTGGFIPACPLDQPIYPGDFFQVRNGEMIVLGNIFHAGVVHADDCRLADKIKLSTSGWNFSDGVSKPYSGRGSGHNALSEGYEFSRQVLAFADRGSFFFRGNNPESVRILNWGDLQQQLIIKLTQTLFSFRKLYVVTESATASDWTLAIAGAERAELEIATDEDNFGLVDIFGHHAAKTIQSRDIEYYRREALRKPLFFKAKKLVVQPERLEVFISDLIYRREHRDEWAGRFYAEQFDHEPGAYAVSGNARASILDMLQANELNPNSALLYFNWADANLDDVEKLFVHEGY